jgi:hypothetical protein
MKKLRKLLSLLHQKDDRNGGDDETPFTLFGVNSLATSGVTGDELDFLATCFFFNYLKCLFSFMHPVQSSALLLP